MNDRTTAAYKIVADSGGTRYKFYCDVSGACACTTKPCRADTPEEELRLAWESEGKAHFNLCHKCGKWVVNAVYNPEVFECTDCAPFEYETNQSMSALRKGREQKLFGLSRLRNEAYRQNAV